MNNYFYNNSTPQLISSSFWREEVIKLKDLGCRFISISKANAIKHQILFDSLYRFQELEFEVHECLPRGDLDFTHIPIPFCYDEHDEYRLNDLTIQDIIETYVNKNFSEKKFLFSTNRNDCLALNFDIFSYNMLHLTSSGRENDWLILFDDTKDQAFFYCYESGFTIFSRKGENIKKLLGDVSDKKWIEYFNLKFRGGIPHATDDYLNFFNTNYAPRISSLISFKQ